MEKGEQVILNVTMKLIAVLAVLLVIAPEASAAEKLVLKTDKDKTSYSMGVDMAKTFKRLGIELNLDIFVRALKDELTGKKLLMSEDEIKQTLNAVQAGLKEKQMQAVKAAAEENQKAGDSFMETNKTKEGVVTLPSGLQYKILKAGDGKNPTEADTVECNYRGTLIDGTEFDSSYKRQKPATFKVSGVIAGWKEALQLMPVGSKWELFIPPQLAYGMRGAPPIIGPNATLVFEIELLAIK
jgi:FKBP-type peptidyl-prolyl cis-trans isomerase